MMARSVYFQTLQKNTGAGSFYSVSTGSSVKYSADGLGMDGVGITPAAPNIQITVPDNWGGLTQSPLSLEGSTVTSFTQKADNVSLNVNIMANGDIDRYYQLRDRFMRMWGAGEFTITVKSGDYHGGSQSVNGYLSSVSFDEFRSQSNVKCSATFVATSPWLFTYGTQSIVVDKKLGDLPTIKGPLSTTDGILKTSYLNITNIREAGVTGLTFYSDDLGNARSRLITRILPEDFDEFPSIYTIMDGVVYAYGEGSVLLGTMTVPDGLIGFSADMNAKVEMVQYAEQYEIRDLIS